MNIPLPIIGIALTAILGIQGWILMEVVSLKVAVARLTQQVADK